MTLLDTERIIERRLALGLSQPALARAIGRSATVVAKLEDGSNHQSLQLGLIERLADVLGEPMSGLMSPAHSDNASTPDDCKLEAMLATAGKGVSAKDLARAADWPLERVHEGLAALKQRLTSSGTSLVQRAGRYRLQPSTTLLSKDEVVGLERALVATDRLSRYEANVLLEATRGEIDAAWLRAANNARRVAVGRLLRLGYIKPDRAGMALTRDARFSLGLDQV